MGADRTADPADAYRELLDAGGVLATLAEPHKDIGEFASDFAEVALTLKQIGAGLDLALDRAEDLYEAAISRRHDHDHEDEMADQQTPRKTYILIACEDGEPTLLVPHHTLGDATYNFRRILDEEPDFEERAVTPGVPLARTVAKAVNPRGDLLLIVERTI